TRTAARPSWWPARRRRRQPRRHSCGSSFYTKIRMATAYLALGSNLGDRAAFIGRALDRLEAAGVRVTARSALHETEAVTPDPQPRFLNGAARVETSLDAGALLSLCLAIERELGRVRPPGRDQAPRTIDIDLLLYGDDVIDRPGLTVPHPRL